MVLWKKFSQVFNCSQKLLWQIRTLRSRNILVFLLKSWSMATTWSVINWCSVAVFLIGIGFTCKKNSRKTFHRLLGRKPRHFCDQVKCSITQVFHTFPGISQICPKIIGCTNNVPAPSLFSNSSEVDTRKRLIVENFPANTEEGHVRPKIFNNQPFSCVYFRRVGKEGGSWYIVCTANNYEMFFNMFNLLLARKNTFFCPKMFLYLSKMIHMSADSEKPHIVGGIWMKYCTALLSGKISYG